MDQVSLPMRIALVATMLFASIWFVALRPKPVDDVDGPLPTAAKPADGSGITSAPEAAKKAVEAASAKEQGREKAAAKIGGSENGKAPATKAPAPKAGATTQKAEAKAPAKAAKPATPAKGPKAVLADIAAGRTVVLLFWDPKSSASDDRAVRRAVSDVDRHGGSVRVHVASINALQGYETITKAAPVEQTPTVFVVDPKKQAHVIDGLTVTREIDALVDRALKVK